jgi:hypothetical protein
MDTRLSVTTGTRDCRSDVLNKPRGIEEHVELVHEDQKQKDNYRPSEYNPESKISPEALPILQVLNRYTRLPLAPPSRCSEIHR